MSSGLFDSKVLLDCLEPVHLVLEFVVDQVPVPLLDHRERRVADHLGHLVGGQPRTDLVYDPLGTVHLRGVPGDWELFAASTP